MRAQAPKAPKLSQSESRGLATKKAEVCSGHLFQDVALFRSCSCQLEASNSSRLFRSCLHTSRIATKRGNEA